MRHIVFKDVLKGSSIPWFDNFIDVLFCVDEFFECRKGMGKVSEGKEREGTLFMSYLHAQELMLFTPGYCHKYNIWPQLRVSAA